MPTLATIRTALKDAVENAVSGIQGYEVVPESVNLPAFVVMPRTSDFMGAMGRGVVTYTFDVIVLVSRRDDSLAQYDLDAFLEPAGDQSVSAAIWDARTTLKAQGIDAHSTGWKDYNASWPFAGIEHVGAALEVIVHANPTT
jgi:hypothetical protein